MRTGISAGWLLGLALAGCIDGGNDGDLARTAQPLSEEEVECPAAEEEFALVDLGIVRSEHGAILVLDNCMVTPEDGQSRLVYFNPARGSAKAMYLELRDGFGADAPLLASAGTSGDLIEVDLETPLYPDRPVQMTVWEGDWERDVALPWAGGYHRQAGQRRTSRDVYGDFVDFDEEFHLIDKPCFPTEPGECVPLPPPPCPFDP